ncbi:MAG: hypothetical protein FD165_1998 [Gammaproteobacteria bacterium]|nr:MAG: hypothetical protein FD165_1998 [Gammaproteobacteria bacterium]TND04990.1 MAG: hypothetical protein FD120_1268 [Gammaproteobacteria bacterium]
MFKRSEPAVQQSAPPAGAIAAQEPQQPRAQATIGSTIRIKGDVSGDENLTIDGTIEGTVTLKQHSLHIGKNGRLNADAYAKVIRIEGHVEGNLYAEEQVLVRQSGIVRGNIVAPRVTMEDGCTFKGSIDMETKLADKKVVSEPRNVTSVIGGGDSGRHSGADKKMEVAAARSG